MTDHKKPAKKVKEDAPVENKTPLTTALKDKLEAEEKKLMEELAPHREFHDKHVNDPKFIKAREKIKEISNKLGPVRNELAALARARGSKGIQAEAGEFKNEE